MIALTLAEFTWRSFAVGAGVVGFLFICILLVLTVLIQRPQGGGLAGAFGSAAGSGQTAFGAKTGDALTIFTIAMFVVYLLAAIGMNFAIKPVIAETAPPAAAAPADSQTPQPPPGVPAGSIPMQAVPGPDGTMTLQPMNAPIPQPAPAPIPVAPESGTQPPAQPATPPATPAPGAETPPAGDKPPASEPKPEPAPPADPK